MYRNLVDHEGNHFDTLKELCSHWEVNPKTFLKRKERGWNLKECLVGREPIKCPDGLEFKTWSEVAEHYCVDRSTLRRRMSRGMSLEQALTRKRRIRNQHT